MSALNHKPTKRRNLVRWMENRLRRIDAKLKNAANCHAFLVAYADFSGQSLARCRDRGHRLASDVQYAWTKANADRIRATQSLNLGKP